ncbi:hypothetical protein RFK22_08520 [Streptococcus suis]|uniref:hypothetical protein n=1 Tax=Streptococcus suis TaxID=1307 RepID=UPI002FCB64F8
MDLIKTFEYFVVYFIPTITFIIQIYGEFKNDKSKSEIGQELDKNEINFDFGDNNGQIVIHQTINKNLNEKVIEYNKNIEDTKFYSSMLFKLSGTVFFVIIVLNIFSGLYENWINISSAPILDLTGTSSTKLAVIGQSIISVMPNIYTQILVFMSLFLFINSLKWGMRIFRGYKISVVKFVYYLFLSALYYFDSQLNPNESVAMYVSKLRPLFSDNTTITVVSIISVFYIIAMIFVSDVVIDRYFDLVKSSKKSERHNQLINLKDNILVMGVGIVIFLVVSYRG